MLEYSKGIKCYLMDISILYKDNIYKTAIDLLPVYGLWKERRERIGRFLFPKDKCRCLGAGLLLLYLFHINDIEQTELIRNDYGKLLLSSQNLDFNISHSGNFVACSVGLSPNGIDIEQICAGNMDLAERFFSPTEFELLGIAGESMFTDIWTFKESYIKAIGKGLSIPLNSFSVICVDFLEEEKLNSRSLFSGKEYRNSSLNVYFREFELEEYKMTICSFGHIVSGIEKMDCLQIINELIG